MLDNCLKKNYTPEGSIVRMLLLKNLGKMECGVNLPEKLPFFGGPVAEHDKSRGKISHI
jgi:hypothetical protein